MDRILLFLGFILLVIVRVVLCIGILLFLILFSPILLLGNEHRFLATIQRLHDYINNE